MILLEDHLTAFKPRHEAATMSCSPSTKVQNQFGIHISLAFFFSMLPC